MIFSVVGFEIAGCQAGVDLGGFQFFVSEHPGYVLDRGAVYDQTGGKGVPQSVRGDGAVEPVLSPQAAECRIDGLQIHAFPAGSPGDK